MGRARFQPCQKRVVKRAASAAEGPRGTSGAKARFLPSCVGTTKVVPLRGSQRVFATPFGALRPIARGASAIWNGAISRRKIILRARSLFLHKPSQPYDSHLFPTVRKLFAAIQTNDIGSSPIPPCGLRQRSWPGSKWERGMPMRTAEKKTQKTHHSLNPRFLWLSIYQHLVGGRRSNSYSINVPFN